MGRINLHDYQLDAVKRMKNGCILCGGVGSGKSRTALAYYYILMGGELDSDEYDLMCDIEIKDLYIITTARKRDTHEWGGELSPFLLSTDSEVSLYSNKIVVDSWNNIKKYKDVKDAFFIFDEQRLVGSGVWVKSFLKITKSNQWILLTATPGDQWSDYIPVFIANGFFKNRTEFSRNHIIWSAFTKFPKIDRYISTGRLIKFRNDILVNMDYIKETISHHEDVYVIYDKEKYRTITRKRWDIWKNKPIENASQYCYALRKVVNLDESRQVALLELIEKHPKVIIFYNFDYELEILRYILRGETNVMRTICGGEHFCVSEWNGHFHHPIPNTTHWAYLVQYTAGAEGWNCTETDTIIFYSQNYSYRTMVQAAGRIDRLNTPFKELYFYHLKSKAPIDIGISRALKNKKNFNERGFYL